MRAGASVVMRGSIAALLAVSDPRSCRRSAPVTMPVPIDDDDGVCLIDERCIYFVTGNAMKEREVNAILAAEDLRPFRVQHVDIDLPELQGDAMEIARAKCQEAARQIGGSVLIEDTSLSFNALNDLPGPYIKWFVISLGLEGLYSLLAAHTDHSAYCQCVVGFSPGPGAEPVLFTGRTHGQIVAPQESGGWGWDAIFVPDGSEEPFSSMDLAQKNQISHRARALAQFVEYAKENVDEVMDAISEIDEE